MKTIEHLQNALIEIDNQIYCTLDEEREIILMNVKKQIVNAIDNLTTF